MEQRSCQCMSLGRTQDLETPIFAFLPLNPYDASQFNANTLTVATENELNFS